MTVQLLDEIVLIGNQTMKDAVLSTLTSTFFIHVLVVVFGAPIIS